jgi:hypothetical protein
MDIIGPMPTTQGNLKYAVAAVEYFSRWVEARPLSTITLATIQKLKHYPSLWSANIINY